MRTVNFSKKMSVVTVLLYGVVLFGKAAADSGTDFVHAAATGNVTYVQQVIDEGTVDLNWKRDDKGFALERATIFNKVEVVKLLLEAGAKVDQGDSGGYTALMSASYHNNVEVVKLLIKAGATVDQAHNDGSTALSDSSWWNSIETVKLLLDAGATVDQGDKNGNTPLMAASKKNNTEVVKLLLDAGATVNQASTRVGMTAIMYASQRDNIEVVKLLLEAGATVDQTDHYGWTSLMHAAFENSTNVARELLNIGANASMLNNNGTNAADIASEAGFNELADIIDDYTIPTFSNSQPAISAPTSTNNLVLLFKVIASEVFLTGALMALATP